jgi:hypothetical protein
MSAIAGGEIEVSNEGGWYKIASFRDYGHTKGVQRVDEAAAHAMANAFNGAVSRVKRWLTGSSGLPVYRGHPDDGSFADHDDTTVYGRIDQVEARADGVYAHITWANEWETLQAERRWRMSPRWLMRQNADGSYSPTKLISLGLTDRPNLPDASFANSTTSAMNLLKLLLAKLGFGEDRITATETNSEGAITPDEAESALAKMTEKSDEAEKAKAELASANERILALETAKAAALATAANERAARATLAVDAAVASGRITAAQRVEWEHKLACADDWAVAANELSSQKPALHVQSQFGDQGTRRDGTVISASNQMRSLVEAQMQSTGWDWANAWTSVSRTEEGKALLASMQTPSK